MRSGLELAGRYRLEELLGQGGMGEVWRGFDQRLRRTVAVKILPLGVGADVEGLARFRREAEIAARLDHPGITTVFDIDEHRDGAHQRLFMVMELLRGRDLQQLITGHRTGLPIEQVTDLARQALDALACAHEDGVVHRDIKPANLFLLDRGTLKICDFGIARLAGATKLTATGSIAGTPVYMAPEQIRGGGVDCRTDLYALGCVLYQLLTGATWVDSAAGVGAVLYQHLEQAPVPPRTVRPEVPRQLDALVMALLAKNPDDRPADAAAAVAALDGPRPHPGTRVDGAPGTALLDAPPPRPPERTVPLRPRTEAGRDRSSAVDSPAGDSSVGDRNVTRERYVNWAVESSPAPSSAPQRGSRRPAVVVGSFALAAAAVALLALWPGGTGTSDSGTAASQSPTAGSGPALTGPEQLYQNVPVSLPGGDCGLGAGLWGNTVSFTDSPYRPAVTVEFGKGPDLVDFTYGCHDEALLLWPVHGQQSIVTGPPQDAAGCAAAIRSNPSSTLLTWSQLREGQQICLVTSSPRKAAGESLVVDFTLTAKHAPATLDWTATAWEVPECFLGKSC